ncbi:MAG: TRAP transporter large permease subunit, partial [Proteobacteria bacterium]|nr:TRAP transporter large permease subunit [Pseudomonadota bacterium]
LAALYMIYIIVIAIVKPGYAPVASHLQAAGQTNSTASIFFSVIINLLPPSLLIFAVLGSIFFGITTPSEAAGVGALGALILAAFHGKLNLHSLKETCHATSKMTGFVFFLIFGAPCFALALRGLGGDEVIESLLRNFAGGQMSFILFSLSVVFVLGFFLDWIEITIILIPLILPMVIEMQIDVYWFAILVAVCLQTSFLTPPMGPALFYVQGIAPKGVRIEHIYRGVIPYVILQLLAIVILLKYPELVTWLPTVMGR